MAWKLRNADLRGVEDTADQEEKRKAKLKPAIVALSKTADTLDYLDKHLFELPLLAPPTSSKTSAPKDAAIVSSRESAASDSDSKWYYDCFSIKS
jgi:hypothetical protein